MRVSKVQDGRSKGSCSERTGGHTSGFGSVVLDGFTLAVEGTVLGAGGRVGALAATGDGRFGRHETRRAEERTLGEHCGGRCRVRVVVVSNGWVMGMGRGPLGMQVAAKPCPGSVCRSAGRPVMSAERATWACSPCAFFP
jgi:hypothetical protein